MIFENVIGNLDDDEYSGYDEYNIEYVNVEWYNANKKIHKFKLENSETIGLRLDHEAMTRGLLQDDVIAKIDDKVIAVNILEEKCIAIKLDDILKASKFSYEIGNRHGSLFVSVDNYLIVPFDQPTFDFLTKLNLEPEIRIAKMHHDRAISNFGNSHSHSHLHNGHSHTH